MVYTVGIRIGFHQRTRLLVWARHELALASPDRVAIGTFPPQVSKRAAPDRIMGTFPITCAETTQFGADYITTQFGAEDIW